METPMALLKPSPRSSSFRFSLKSKILCLLAVLAGLLATQVSTQAQVVLYRQVFGNGTGSNQLMSYVPWLNYQGSGAVLATTGGRITGATGNPTNLGNVNSSVTETSQSNGNFFGTTPTNVSGNGIQMIIANAAEVSFLNTQLGGPVELSADLEFSWYSANSNATNKSSLVLQIADGVNSPFWIVSNTQFTSAATNMTSGIKHTLDFSFAAADWSILNFTPGSNLSVGSVLTQDLSEATISGFGLLARNSSTTDNYTARFDTFQISVPEPSTVALIAASLGLMLVKRHRVVNA